MEADGTLVRRGRELLEQEIERFTVVEHDGVLVGCAALYPFSEDNAAELACLAVVPEYRRAGLGDQLLRRIERRARVQRLDAGQQLGEECLALGDPGIARQFAFHVIEHQVLSAQQAMEAWYRRHAVKPLVDARLVAQHEDGQPAPRSAPG